jgi:2-amino-4-hydroxy-6-hydroxymethyldihydropteridine diphosphokinase
LHFRSYPETGIMIVIGIGSNLAAPGYASPLHTATATLAQLPRIGISLGRRSRWYLSEPVPPSDQPWYINGVAIIETRLAPTVLLAALLRLEARFGRRRSGVPHAARTLDLDLLDYDGRRVATRRLILPHPRLHQRRFVLAPLAEIAPRWRHPLIGLTAAALLARLPPSQPVRALGRLGDRLRSSPSGNSGGDRIRTHDTAANRVTV